jgi:hypothetical protein
LLPALATTTSILSSAGFVRQCAAKANSLLEKSAPYDISYIKTLLGVLLRIEPQLLLSTPPPSPTSQYRGR